MYAWSWAYLARAALRAYEGTGQRRFVDLVADTGDRILADGDGELGRLDEFRQRVLRTWGTCGHLEDTYTSVLTHAGRIGYPLARFCWIVAQDEKLEALHGSRAARFLAAAEEALAEFEPDYRVVDGTDQGYYVRPTRRDVDPINHVHCAGETFVLLYVLTGKQEYRQRVVELANFFVAAVRTEVNGSFTWPYQPAPHAPGDRKAPPEPVSKAQITILFPLSAYEHGLFFEAEHMEALARTIRLNIHRGGNRFQQTISAGGQGHLMEGPGPSGRHCLLAGWIYLDRFDPQVRTIIERAVAHRRDIFPGGWFQRPVTAMAYSYRFLSRGIPTNSTAPETDASRDPTHPAPSFDVETRSPSTSCRESRLASALENAPSRRAKRAGPCPSHRPPHRRASVQPPPAAARPAAGCRGTMTDRRGPRRPRRRAR